MSPKNQTTAIDSCRVSLNNRIHSRRCFMTGEYCSQLANIQKARERLHKTPEDNGGSQAKDGEINAFVIMNFSNMSDVAYKWRLQPFIESLTKYLYFEGNELVCCADQKKVESVFAEQEVEEYSKAKDYTKVECRGNSKLSSIRPVSKINVIRADSNYDSNYVICNRVCQQIQMADLIVVDVSSENNNVFYEFGMAVALGKLILPICFGDSFFQIRIPDALKEYVHKNKDNKEYRVLEHLQRHIDCYPWRRALFEHYGLRYRSKNDSEDMNQAILDGEDKQSEKGLYVSTITTTQYIEFREAKEPRYGFSDTQYGRFPYVELNDGSTYIGERIYNRLGNSYNKARYENNTLIVYTMDGFQNEEQAGVCIVNFYKYMTKQLQKEQCFCGDRVGILVEPSGIPESVKDSKEKRHLLYSVGDVIHLGMNEATYAAQQEVIKANDYLTVPSSSSDLNLDEKNTILIFTKNHIRNKSVTIYPRIPVYVKRIAYGLQPKLLDINGTKDPNLDVYFCYFHVMLRTLKYVNQLVVDISKNSLESLFWLGAAHGGNITAITVQHEESDQERTILTGSPEKRERAIFDVAGLWSALLHTYDTEGFYLQLEMAQKGIEQRSRLMLQNRGRYKDQLENFLYGDTSEVVLGESDNNKAVQNIEDPAVQQIVTLIKEQRKMESLALESYYRDRFWKPMLSNEHLRIYYHQVDGMDRSTGNPKVSVGKWDIDAISVLSHYLSVRTHVGEHSLVSLHTDKPDEDNNGSNFISIGNDAKPLKSGTDEGKGIPLADHILEEHSLEKDIHIFARMSRQNEKTYKCDKNATIQYQGFCNQDHYLYTQIPCPQCLGCMECESVVEDDATPCIPTVRCFKMTQEEKGVTPVCDKIKKRLMGQFQDNCYISSSGAHHFQVAQLVLWREVDRKNHRVWYQVSMNGASGPATKALSSLVVNDKHRRKVFYSKGRLDTERIPMNPLSELQEKARKEFSETFYNKIGENFNTIKIVDHENSVTGIDQSRSERLGKEAKKYEDQIKHAALLYLSSVLYRHFLPFLSLEDEHRIENGMRYFLASLFASKTINVKLDGKIEDIAHREKSIKDIQVSMIECTIQAFKSVIQYFSGIEVLYQVDVLADNDDKNDSRVCVGMELLNTAGTATTEVSKETVHCKTNVKPVHCLFLCE